MRSEGQILPEMHAPAIPTPKAFKRSSTSKRNGSGTKKKSLSKSTTHQSRSMRFKENNGGQLVHQRSESSKRSENGKSNRSMSDKTSLIRSRSSRIAQKPPSPSKESPCSKGRVRASSRLSKKDTELNKPNTEGFKLQDIHEVDKVDSSKKHTQELSKSTVEAVRKHSPCFTFVNSSSLQIQ